MRNAENNGKEIKRQHIATLDSQLSKASTDLMAMLSGINVLNKEHVISKIRVYEKTLETIQKDFIAHLSTYLNELPETEKIKLRVKKDLPVAEVVTGLFGAGGVVALVTLVTIAQTSGWWLLATTTEVSIASIIAGILGVSINVATGGIALTGGLAVVAITNKTLKNSRRKSVNEKIDKLVSNTDGKIKTWAENILGSIFNVEIID